MRNRIAQLVERNKELLEKSDKAIKAFDKVNAELQESIKKYKELKEQDDEAVRVIQELINCFDMKGASAKDTDTALRAVDFINNKLF